MKENEDVFTRQEIVVVYKARNYQAILGWMSTSTIISYMSKNLIMNFYIAVNDKKMSRANLWNAHTSINGKYEAEKPE